MDVLETVGFILLATLALASAMVVVFHKTPIISALALAFNLVGDGLRDVLDPRTESVR